MIMSREIRRRVFTALYPISHERDKKSNTKIAMVPVVFMEKNICDSTYEAEVIRKIKLPITTALLGATKNRINILLAARAQAIAVVNFFSLKVAMLSIIIGRYEKNRCR